jgi:hypothetical protein
VKTRFSRLRARLNFANVTASLALFIALGGTSYAAATLPRNSVGKSQIRSSAVGKSEIATNGVGRSEVRRSAVSTSEIVTNGVGKSEIKTNAIGTAELRDGEIGAADLSDAAKAANGVTFRAAAAGDGTGPKGNAKSITRTGAGVYSVDLGQDVSNCQVSATIAGTGATPGLVTVVPGATTNLVTVNTFDAVGGTAGAAADRPFSLLVAC